VLNLSIRARIYVRNRLYDRDRKIYSNTPFFRPDGILPANGSAGKTGKPILIKAATQLTELFIPIERKKE
jgi:hypothetical protein